MAATMKWDNRFLNMARLVAQWSKDQSTKCGAVITDGKRIVSVGFNGFPNGTHDDDSLYNDREEKYRRIIHAEENALLFANKPLNCCTCYVWPMPPCSNCAAKLIQSGITRVVTVAPTVDQAERWYKSFESMTRLLSEANVTIDYIGEC